VHIRQSYLFILVEYAMRMSNVLMFECLNSVDATRSSAIAKRPHDAQGDSRSFEVTLLSKACVSPH